MLNFLNNITIKFPCQIQEWNAQRRHQVPVVGPVQRDTTAMVNTVNTSVTPTDPVDLDVVAPGPAVRSMIVKDVQKDMIGIVIRNSARQSATHADPVELDHVIPSPPAHTMNVKDVPKDIIGIVACNSARQSATYTDPVVPDRVIPSPLARTMNVGNVPKDLNRMVSLNSENYMTSEHFCSE